MPGIEDEPPTEDQMVWMRQKFKDYLDENGQGNEHFFRFLLANIIKTTFSLTDNFEPDDIRRVMEDDKYLGRFFMHFFDESGDQAELGVTMIINSLQWRKTMDIKGTQKGYSLQQ